MANKKKKKTPPKRPSEYGITKSYFDQFAVTARKVLQLLELDPAIYDEFTKRQKQEIMHVKFAAPKVLAKAGHRIPQRLIKAIQQALYEFLKLEYVGDKHIGLSVLDFSTMGMAFIAGVKMAKSKNDNHPNYELITKQCEIYESNPELDKNLISNFIRYIQYVLNGVSKLNFRIYGFDWVWKPVDNSSLFGAHIILSETKSEIVNFSYKGVVRPGYRVTMGEFASDPPHHLGAAYNRIVKTSTSTKRIEFYIQNHALNRLKERLDTVSAFHRNIYLNSSLLICNTTTLESGKVVIRLENVYKELLGYLPFTIVNQNLFILSFIPLSSPAMPEGKLLCEALNTEKNDLIFLGMDKLSFYQNTDFDTVPHLRDALKKAGMWHLTEIKPEENFNESLYGQNSSTINRFFRQQTTEPNKEEILGEIEKIY